MGPPGWVVILRRSCVLVTVRRLDPRLELVFEEGEGTWLWACPEVAFRLLKSSPGRGLQKADVPSAGGAAGLGEAQASPYPPQPVTAFPPSLDSRGPLLDAARADGQEQRCRPPTRSPLPLFAARPTPVHHLAEERQGVPGRAPHRRDQVGRNQGGGITGPAAGGGAGRARRRSDQLTHRPLPESTRSCGTSSGAWSWRAWCPRTAAPHARPWRTSLAESSRPTP